MKKPNLILPSMLAGFALAASANAATIIVAEDFGGLAADNLNGTTADTFNSAITSAGGSATWVGNAVFKADGSATGMRMSAHLTLGEYINNTKGTASGLFVLQATLELPTVSASNTTDWFSLGFSNANSPGTTRNFIAGGSGTGAGTTTATMIYRANGDIDQFNGNGPNGEVAADNVLFSGPRILTITLDLRAWDGSTGWNGIDRWGTVTYGANTGLGDTYEEYGSANLPNTRNFNSILLSLGDNSNGDTVTSSYSSLTLTQIPEPTTALLGGLGMLALLRRRREA